MEDQAIIHLYWNRSERAISETDAKYGPLCHSLAYNILENQEDAEESVSDTYLAAWNAMPPHRPSFLMAFLAKLTRRVSINRWRAIRACKRGGGQVQLALEELQDCASAEPAVEDVAPYVEVIGKTIVLNDYTLTIDGFLYDSATQCGLVTYSVENPNGISDYDIHPDGRMDMGIVYFTQYGYPYILQDKTTDTKVTAAYYFCYDPNDREGVFEVFLYDDRGYNSAADSDQLDAQLRQDYTPEEAMATARVWMGDGQYEKWVSVNLPYWDEATSAYIAMRDMILTGRADPGQESQHLSFDCSRSNALNHITLEGGSITISPISIRVDVDNMDFLRGPDGVLKASCIDALTIIFDGGTEYVLAADGVDNKLFTLGSAMLEDHSVDHSLLTCMFNRVIDVETVVGVTINAAAFFVG